MQNTTLSLVWAKMPLSEEELSKIPKSHRIRPYLILFKEENFYYAFPSTSQFYKKKSRYQNSTLLSRCSNSHSLIMLDHIYKLPKENIISIHGYLSEDEENELFKKLKANIKYSNYPLEIINYIENKQTNFTWNDLISYDNKLYLIFGHDKKDSFYCLEVYTYETDNTIEKVVDGLKYYINPLQIIKIKDTEFLEYKTIIYGFSMDQYKKSKKDLISFLKSISNHKKILSNIDFTKFVNLQEGMIIQFNYNNEIKKAIILSKNDKYTKILIGNENQMYRDFELIELPNDIEINYTIIGTLDNERTNKLKTLFLVNEEKLQLNR